MFWWLKVLATATLAASLTAGVPIKNSDVTYIEEVKFREPPKRNDKAKLFETDTYRLPNSSLPINYDITLRTDVHSGNFDFTGQVKIEIEVREPNTQEIVLHYRQTVIESINMFTPNGTTLLGSNLPSEKLEQYEFLVITLPSPYTTGDRFILDISYRGQLRSDDRGFFRLSYTNASNNTVHYAATQFEIDDARHAMPCYDEPGIRAPMTLTMIHGNAYFAISNTNVDQMTIDSPEVGYTTTKFKPTPSMQTYLLAFVVSDFDHVNALSNSTRVDQKVYAKSETIASGEVEFAVSVVGEVLRVHEQKLNVLYTIDKVDHAVISARHFSAMENLGLITYAENDLLISRGASESQKYTRESAIVGLISHEFAHQWFGNLVSPKWWTYTWLNEGFATLFQSYIPSLIYPERKLMNSFTTYLLPVSFSSDSGNSWAMNHYTEDPARLWEKFGAIGYHKAACVLRMFMEVITEEVFLRGLNRYLNHMALQAATPDDLHESLQQIYDDHFPDKPLNIGELMYTWENQPGYPLVSVSIAAGNRLQFSQRRYPVSNGEIYSVPLTIATKSNHDFSVKTPKLWLHNAITTFTQADAGFAAGDWIVVNIQQVGYYRVDYDTTLWRAIIEQLTTDASVIDPINRAVLQDEIYMAWTSLDRVTARDVLRILSYFGREDEPIAWSKASNSFTTFNNRLFGTVAYESLLSMLRTITAPHLDVLGYYGVDGEKADWILLRSSTRALNCLALDGNCLITEYSLFSRYYFDGADVNFNYCDAIRLLGVRDFTVILNGVLTNGTYRNRDSFLENFGCSLYEDSLLSLLNAVLDTTNILNDSERAGIVSNTFRRSSIAMSTTLNFIEEKHAELNLIIPSAINTLLSTIATFVNDQPNTAQFDRIVTKMQSVGAISSENKATIDAIVSSNNAWINENFEDVLIYFGLVDTTAKPTTTSPVTSSETPPTTTTSSNPRTNPPTTTPASADSIALSIGLLVVCVIIDFIRT